MTYPFHRGTKIVTAYGECHDCPRTWPAEVVTTNMERTLFTNKVRNHATRSGHQATMKVWTTWTVPPATADPVTDATDVTVTGT